MTLLVDPPSGWQYGFPAELQADYPAQLRAAGYPERDIQFALEHSRFIGTQEELHGWYEQAGFEGSETTTQTEPRSKGLED